MTAIHEWNGFSVFSVNIPKERPGIYLIEHLSSGRRYVGISQNVANRIRKHLVPESPGRRQSKIHRALTAEGPLAFIAVPLFYSLKGTQGLHTVEAELIRDLRCIEHGYNVVAVSGPAGSKGPLHSALVSAGLNRPEVRARLRANEVANAKTRGAAIRAAHAKPETKVRLRARRRGVIGVEMQASVAAHMKQLKNTPYWKKRNSRQMNALYADPDFRANHLRQSRKANASPERNAKISASRRGGKWITDGVALSFIGPSKPIPDGWYIGRPNKAIKY